MTGRGAERLTIFGRKPVIEALDDERLAVERIVIARASRGPAIATIRSMAQTRGVPVTTESIEGVNRLSRRPKQDQGVVAVIQVDLYERLERYLERCARPDALPLGTLLVLDSVTNPANVGMIIRSSAAAGLAGVVMPWRKVAGVGPLLIKASAGVALRSPVLRVESAPQALELLQEAGYLLVGLAATAPTRYFDSEYPPATAFVLGGETEGVSPEAASWIHQWVSIPMASGVESLNVACAATAIAFELARRTLVAQGHEGASGPAALKPAAGAPTTTGRPLS